MTCSNNSADIFLCLSMYYHFYLLLDNPFDNNHLKSAVSFPPPDLFPGILPFLLHVLISSCFPLELL